jgi:hypothetical protein
MGKGGNGDKVVDRGIRHKGFVHVKLKRTFYPFTARLEVRGRGRCVWKGEGGGCKREKNCSVTVFHEKQQRSYKIIDANSARYFREVVLIFLGHARQDRPLCLLIVIHICTITVI